MRTRAHLSLIFFVVALATAWAAGAPRSVSAQVRRPAASDLPARLATDPVTPNASVLLLVGSSPSLIAFPTVSGTETPELLLAQRAIERTWKRNGATTQVQDGSEDGAQYQYVEVEGWRSPARALALSGVAPGAGQWYVGSATPKRYLFLGVEAVALFSYFHFRAQGQERRDEAFAYAGDPNDPASRWSFEGYSGSAADAARLREIYAKDPDEFYSLVSHDEQYLSGWKGNSDRSGYLLLDDKREDAERRSRYGLVATIANHVVSMVDAVRDARLNNFRISQGTTLKFDAQTGRRSHLYAFLTHRFK